MLASSSQFDFSDGNTPTLDLTRLPLSSWGLSDRTLNAILRFNFKMTVGDLFALGNDFHQIRGLDIGGIRELQNKMGLLATNKEKLENSQESDAISLVKTLSQEALLGLQDIPLDWLHLDRKTHKTLLSAGITNVKSLCCADGPLIGNLQGYHQNSLSDINHKIVSLFNSINELSDIGWFKYWNEQNIAVLPATNMLDTPTNIIKSFNGILERILHHEKDDRLWLILKRRYGLANEPRLTLDEMGTAFGLSRERIRQLEAKALRILRDVILSQQYSDKPYHIHPSIRTMVLSVYEMIDSSELKCFLEENIFLEFQIQWGKISETDRNIIYLFLDLLDMRHVEFDCSGTVSAWGILDAEERRSLEQAVNKLNDLLTKESALPHTELDTLIYLNKGAKKSQVFKLSQIPGLVDLCVSVEKREDGLLWGLFSFLQGRDNQVERLLTETGKPLSASELTREINHRLVSLGKQAVQETNLRNQLVVDKRFIPIGRSGQWGLRTWKHIDTKNILTLMQDFLITRNQPATIDEIYEYVSERRPASKNSIIAYLAAEHGEFARFGQTAWGLVQWTNNKSAREKKQSNKQRGLIYQQVAEQVRDILEKAPQKQLLKSELMQKLQSMSEYSESTLYNYIEKLNFVDKIGGGKEKICRLKENLITEVHRTTREKMAETVKNLLERAPGNQLSLKEIIAQLQKVYDNPKHTLYRYIALIDCIELVDSTDHTLSKVYRLKDAQNPTIPSLVQLPSPADVQKHDKNTLPIPDLVKANAEPHSLNAELKIFYCYAREDQALREKLERYLTHLKRRYRFSTWFDRQILPGDAWESVIEAHLYSADLIFLLISPDFMASDYCYNKEMQYALDKHAKGQASVIPILLRPTYWDGAPFGHIQMLPSNSTPVTRWNDLDEAFQDIIMGVNKVIQSLLLQTKRGNPG